MGEHRFELGEVVMCADDRGAPMIRKGHVYRIASQIPGYEGYTLDGIEVAPPAVGFWGSRFRRVPGHWSLSGQVHRVPA